MSVNKALAIGLLAALPGIWAAAVQAERGRPRPLERLEDMLEDIKEEDPEFYKEVQEGKEEVKHAIRQKLGEMGPMLGDKEFRRAAFRTIRGELKVRRMAQLIREEEDAKKKEPLKKELKEALESAFDAKVGIHEMRLKHMEKEIENLREQITKRRKLKEKIIEKRLAEISGDEEGWDW